MVGFLSEGGGRERGRGVGFSYLHHLHSCERTEASLETQASMSREG